MVSIEWWEELVLVCSFVLYFKHKRVGIIKTLQVTVKK